MIRDYLVSIVMPVYNVEKYVGKCIESILGQTYSNIELIAVDDGSTDNSGKICDEYSLTDNRMVVYHKKNGGLSDARNYGCKYAKGEYLVFVDSDDYLDDTNYFSHIAKVIERKSPDYIITRYKKCDERGENIYTVGTPWNEFIINSDDFSKKMAFVLNSGYFNISAWAKVIKREFFEKNQLFFVDGHSEDIDWTSRIINSTKKIEVINDDAYVYRIRTSSLSHHFKKRQCLDLGKRLIDWKKLINEDDEFAQAQLGYIAYEYFIYIAILHYLSKEEQKEVWEQAGQLADIVKYSKSKKAKASALLCKILGVKLGSFVLYQYIIRKRV